MSTSNKTPTFNLWHDPWIEAERPDGTLETVSIHHLLANAADYRGLFDPSPLVTVGIHRLLVAILQDIFQPEYDDDLLNLWDNGRFPTADLDAFGGEYGHRFDLFSAEHPFLQSADLPLHPKKPGKGKSVGYLFQEQTAGTGVTHYNHVYEDEQQFCAACAAKGLLTLPAFASSGGAGIRPSINGVPPVYVIPGGHTYYHSLVASLTTPAYQPEIADRENDTPWWRHDPVIVEKQVVTRVGYLHSLTFPVRRVRLHPHRQMQPCTRCGRKTTWGVAEMIYKMGQWRGKEAAFWRDPFAAYYISKKDEPIPVRPREGRAPWRDFAAFFLPHEKDAPGYRPAVLTQLEHLLAELPPDLPYNTDTPYPFHTIGLRTDMKMKIFEWVRAGFQVTPQLLRDADLAVQIRGGLDFAQRVDSICRSTFRQYFGGGAKVKKHENLKERMTAAYWDRLSLLFHEHIDRWGTAADSDAGDEILHDWLKTVINTGESTFAEFAALVGNDAASLRDRVQAVNHNRAKMYAHRNKKHPRKEKTA